MRLTSIFQDNARIIACATALIVAAFTPITAAANDTPKYTCTPDQCDPECIGQDEGLCLLPFECPYGEPGDPWSGEKHPHFDQCSTPMAAIAASGMLGAITNNIYLLYVSLALETFRTKFAESDNNHSSPCYLHDLCYRSGRPTYDYSQRDCDEDMTSNLNAYCRNIEPWRANHKSLCWAARAAMMPAVFLFGHLNYNKPDRRGTCCNWERKVASSMTPECFESWKYLQNPDYPTCTGAPGLEGCECLDVQPFPTNQSPKLLLSEEPYSPDGAGSFMANRSGLGQYCIGEDMVCGRHKVLSGNFVPVCQQCGEDTNIGCPCKDDDACGGIANDGALRCFGSEEEGWRGAGNPSHSDDGVCLPDPDAPDRVLDLEDVPWFCLENCDVLDRRPGQTHKYKTCLYRELRGHDIEFTHGTCVAVDNVCNDVGGAGVCESDPTSVNQCDTRTLGGNCEPECVPGMTDGRCAELGFPEDFKCVDGACVPDRCSVSGGEAPEFCDLYK